MRRSPGIGHEPSLKRLAITSFILHALLLSVLIIPLRTGEREFRSYHVNLVEPVKARTSVKTPATRKAKRRVPARKKMVTKEKKVARKKPLPAKKMVKKKIEPETDSSAERILQKIEKLRAIKKLTTEKHEREKTREIEVIRKRLSEETGRGPGIPGKGKHLDPNSYYAIITQKIWSEWIYPDLDSDGLEVIISIKIDSEGKVVSHSVEKTSGNMLFDHSAIKAISKASPLPPPPVEIEVGVRFYL